MVMKKLLKVVMYVLNIFPSTNNQLYHRQLVLDQNLYVCSQL